ncbi:hypothetical protein ACX84U_27775, partial [Burkholderia pseudomallei]
MTVTRRAAARVVRPLCRWLAFGGWAEVSDREPGACDRALGHRRTRSRRRRDPPSPATGPCRRPVLAVAWAHFDSSSSPACFARSLLAIGIRAVPC